MGLALHRFPNASAGSSTSPNLFSPWGHQCAQTFKDLQATCSHLSNERLTVEPHGVLGVSNLTPAPWGLYSPAKPAPLHVGVVSPEGITIHLPSAQGQGPQVLLDTLTFLFCIDTWAKTGWLQAQTCLKQAWLLSLARPPQDLL